MVFKVKDAPLLGANTDEEITEFIDQYVSTAVPDAAFDAEMHNNALLYQQHGHRPSCQKKKMGKEATERLAALDRDKDLSVEQRKRMKTVAEEDGQCRFDYPKPPVKKTWIDYETVKVDGKDVDARVVLEAKKTEWREEAKRAGLSDEATDIRVRKKGMAYLQASKVSIHYKRDPGDPCTNNYNSAMLRCWGANMDLQYCVNARGLLAYVCRCHFN